MCRDECKRSTLLSEACDERIGCSDGLPLGWPSGAGSLKKSRMQFLRTLFWVVVAVFIAIMARNNWTDVTLNLWGSLQADIKLPLLIAVAFLLGFLPPFVLLRAKVWRLRRKLALAEQPVPLTGNRPASAAPELQELTR